MHGGQPLLIFCKNKNTHRECENDIWPCAALERFVILYRKRDSAPGWGRRRFCQTHDARILYNLCGNGGCMNKYNGNKQRENKNICKTTTKGTKTRREQPKKRRPSKASRRSVNRPAGIIRAAVSLRRMREPAIPVKIYRWAVWGKSEKTSRSTNARATCFWWTVDWSFRTAICTELTW